MAPCAGGQDGGSGKDPAGETRRREGQAADKRVGKAHRSHGPPWPPGNGGKPREVLVGREYFEEVDAQLR